MDIEEGPVHFEGGEDGMTRVQRTRSLLKEEKLQERGELEVQVREETC